MMAYASWSVVFGEQPSAAKWNILGTNDSSFNDGTGIANGAITAAHMGDSGWINVTFQNSYSAQNSVAVSYRKIGNRVQLRGQPGNGGTLNTNTIFTLPSGYRPAQTCIFSVPNGSANVSKFIVNTDGTCAISVVGSSSSYVGIDGISFLTD